VLPASVEGDGAAEMSASRSSQAAVRPVHPVLTTEIAFVRT
jgi:hypothetical protein